jgi:hypothetical protein
MDMQTFLTEQREISRKREVTPSVERKMLLVSLRHDREFYAKVSALARRYVRKIDKNIAEINPEWRAK